MKTDSLAPTQSPGEAGTLVVYGAVLGIATAFGVDSVKAAAIAGAIAGITPYIVKAVVWFLNRKKQAEDILDH
jgi:hypothetical protein